MLAFIPVEYGQHLLLEGETPMTTPDGTSRRATIALSLLVLINLFNYIDRQVLAAVESSMEETYFPDSEYPRDPKTNQRLDKTIEGKMGSLNTAFMVSYMLIAPIFGFLADRMPRWLLVGIGVIAWSLATGATGLAATFVILFLTRCLVGVGEAAYGPVAPTVISDLYPVQKRGSVMAIFYVAIPVGSALGYVLGGLVSGWTGDWRWAFFVVVPPGLLLGLWCFLMKDPPRGSADPGAVARRASWADYMVALKTPSYVLVTLGMTAMTFAMGGMAFWLPRYGVERQAAGVLTAEDRALIIKKYGGSDIDPDDLIEQRATDYLKAGGEFDDPEKRKEVRKRLDDLRNHVNLMVGVILVISGLGATIAGGIAGDKLKARFSGAYFLVSAVAMGIAFPLILAALWTPFPLAWLFIFLSCFCLFFNTGPTNTILANVTHPSIRASAFAMNILIIHALGDAVSPPIIGFINGFAGNMTAGFLTVSFMCLLASVLWYVGAKHLQRDTELAPTRLAQ
jgi:MFS family permease